MTAPLPSLPSDLGESLVAWGAPLAGWSPVAHDTLEKALLDGLRRSRRHATVFRALPVLVAQQEARIDWPTLREAAQRQGLERELGLLLELTGERVSSPRLHEEADRLRPAAPPTPEFFFPPRNRWDRELAQEQSPALAACWGFVVNMTLDALRSLLERHASLPAR